MSPKVLRLKGVCRDIEINTNDYLLPKRIDILLGKKLM
jgi:hypothetical protein